MDLEMNLRDINYLVSRLAEEPCAAKVLTRRVGLMRKALDELMATIETKPEEAPEAQPEEETPNEVIEAPAQEKEEEKKDEIVQETLFPAPQSVETPVVMEAAPQPVEEEVVEAPTEEPASEPVEPPAPAPIIQEPVVDTPPQETIIIEEAPAVPEKPAAILADRVRSVTDIKQLFTLNDNFRFSRELFGGSMKQMQRALAQVSAMPSFNHAAAYLPTVIDADADMDIYEEFGELIKKYFE